MNKSKLKKEIKKKLDQLEKLLNKTDEARVIKSDDIET
jgi:outer membrane protein OmpA-like peptidoglycan-associated protein